MKGIGILPGQSNKNIKEKINPNFNGTLTKRKKKTINRIKDGNISSEIATGTCEPSTICLYHDGEIRGDLDKKYTYQELTKMTGKYTNLYIFYHDIENTKKLDGAKPTSRWISEW
ncbi:hypothetical protein ACEW7V_02595 [Areca yellow leaf disease phytoplasma]|uniref:hypothetical protein n=1 Tax=Areca yellow leaf disease phytoplasma TaxID=927614 RepID=UPI0035B50151